MDAHGIKDSLEAADGLDLACFHHLHPAAKGTVVFLHDFGEHCGRYEAQFLGLREMGLDVHGLDLRGHGHSQGERGNAGELADWLDDLDLFLARIKHSHGGKPTFLWGHGIGALLAALYSSQHRCQWAGLIMSAPILLWPSIRQVAGLPGWFDHAGPWLGRLLPSLKVGAYRMAPFVSAHSSVRAAYEADPLNFDGPLWARTGRALRGAIGAVEHGGLHDVRCPMLILQGRLDRLGDLHRHEDILGELLSFDRETRVYDGLAHDLWHDEESWRVTHDLCEWLREKLTLDTAG